MNNTIISSVAREHYERYTSGIQRNFFYFSTPKTELERLASGIIERLQLAEKYTADIYKNRGATCIASTLSDRDTAALLNILGVPASRTSKIIAVRVISIKRYGIERHNVVVYENGNHLCSIALNRADN